ncbi:MAG: c-type cytochrome [Phycisphaerales bacterium]|nr:MAG: c-type cytochrome [Phycisphaerales bacterium]
MKEDPGKCSMLVCVLTATVLLGGECLAKTGNYLSPVSVVADGDERVLYVAEATADQVAVFDIAPGEVTGTIPVADNPTGLAISADHSKLYVTSAVPAGRVQVIDIRRGNVSDSIAVGHTPVAVVASPDGETLYVCNQFDNSIGVVELGSKTQTAKIAVTREPVAAALTSDARFLFVANHLPAGAANGDYAAAVVSVIDTAARKVIKNIELPNGSTNLRGITISPDGKNAYVTHILARYQFPTAYLEQGWVNTNAMTIIDVPGRKFVNTVLLDDVDLGAANPYGIVCTADGKNILITHAGTHELSVIDRAGLHRRLLPARTARTFRSEICSTVGTKHHDASYSADDVPNDLTFLTGLRRRVGLAGNGPRGLTVIGTKVYAAEYFTDSIGLVDINSDIRHRAKSVPLGEEKALTKARMGEMFFHDASHSFQKWHSCASCHSGGGRACALNWDLLNDGMLNPKNTKSLLLSHKTPPAMITGVRANAETAVRSGIRYIQFSSPWVQHARAMDEYLKSLEPIASPYLVSGKLSTAAKNGEKLYSRAGCVRCHGGTLYTNMGKYDVGTGTGEDVHREFDTPTLVEVWRTAPYLHDGRAATIRELLTEFNKDDRHGKTSDLSEKEIADLAEYVLTL